MFSMERAQAKISSTSIMVGFKFNTHEKNDVFDFGIFGVKMIVLTGTLKKLKKISKIRYKDRDFQKSPKISKLKTSFSYVDIEFGINQYQYFKLF